MLNDSVNDDDSDEDASTTKIQVCEASIIDELAITDDEEAYKFIKTPQQQKLASAKHKAISIDSDSNDKSDKNNIKGLKVNRLTKMH